MISGKPPWQQDVIIFRFFFSSLPCLVIVKQLLVQFRISFHAHAKRFWIAPLVPKPWCSIKLQCYWVWRLLESGVWVRPRQAKAEDMKNLGFIFAWIVLQRFNVAVTRAKALMIVIGNPNILRHNASWSKWVCVIIIDWICLSVS